MDTYNLKLLAALLCEPEDVFWQADVFGKMRDRLSEDDPVRGELDALCALTAGLSEAQKQEILVDYTRLFVGAGRACAAPYMCLWADAEHPWETEKLIDFFDRAGIALSQNLGDLPEHLAVLVEALALLREGGEKDEADARELLVDYILPYAPAWCEALQKAAGTDYYRTVASLFDRWIRSEQSASR